MTGVETWENVTESTVALVGTDNKGAERAIVIPGKGRAQVKTEDRETMELSNPYGNPFVTGFLRRVDSGATAEQRTAALTDDELREVVEWSPVELEKWLDQESELNVRRLAALAKKETVGSQLANIKIRESVAARFPYLDYTQEQRELLEARRD